MSQALIVQQECETCGGITDWFGPNGEDLECRDCGNTEQPYDPFEED